MARQNGKEPTEKKSLRAGSKKKPIPRKTAVFSSDDEDKEGGVIKIDDSQKEEEEQPDNLTLTSGSLTPMRYSHAHDRRFERVHNCL